MARREWADHATRSAAVSLCGDGSGSLGPDRPSQRGTVIVRLSFHGAARSVTGSRHMLEVPGFRLLLDCGLFQERRDEALRQNRDFVFDPKSLSAVLLSHAHVDHSGALPMLKKHGFSGKVYLTRATADL